jgi:hypothetical protein
MAGILRRLGVPGLVAGLGVVTSATVLVRHFG